MEIIRECRETFPSLQIIEELITPVLDHLGDQWEEGDIALSQIYMAGIICEKIVLELMDTVKVERAKRQPKAAFNLDFRYFFNAFHGANCCFPKIRKPILAIFGFTD
jgi:hypothetical protein